MKSFFLVSADLEQKPQETPLSVTLKSLREVDI